jgi:glycosyltransferase involved in cell wall biosynthesis
MKEEITHTINNKIVQPDYEPFVSVLTPVYNGEEFLRECIESVLAQDYSNWEYVLVNNQSTDSSLQIMEEYAARDKRIRIHNNDEFLPQMESLNYAFRQISPDSKYCKPLDDDDCMFPNCLTKMVEVAEKYPAAGIVGAYALRGKKVGLDGLPRSSDIFTGKEIALQYLLNGKHYFGPPSSKLIRSSLIRKREKVYDPSYLESDVSACLDMFLESDFGFVHQVLTFSREHPDRITNTVVKKQYTYMLSDLIIHMDYGHLFLSGKVHKQVMKERENNFYIQFARNMLSGEMKRWYQHHTEQLESINFRVKHGKLFIYLMRELPLKLIKKCGYRLVKLNTNT